MKVREGFRVDQMLDNKKILRKFRKDRAEYKRKDKFKK